MPYTMLPNTRVPVRVWTDPATIEYTAAQQLHNIGRLSWVDGVAVMPDVHFGKGATVGAVIAMRHAVAPAAVGVDIGCGMSAVRTSLFDRDLPDDLRLLRHTIEEVIPVGFDRRDQAIDPHTIPGLEQGGWDDLWQGFTALDPGVARLETKAHLQLGTLGGGNHFIEVSVEQTGPETGRVWLMLHSGSRNIGKELAQRHIAKARRLPHNHRLPDRDLAVFLCDTPEMAAYRHDVYWAQEYARRNRAVMLALFCNVVREALPQVRFEEPISCHHNYIAEENHGGVDMLITRKGAIRAQRGDLGIVPGSMGTSSYIVRGLGNPDSYCSAAHGAGRRMSRADVKRTYTKEDLARQTAGVESRKDAGVLDEIPAAYKDIDAVMADQADLVETVAHLKQIITVKG